MNSYRKTKSRNRTARSKKSRRCDGRQQRYIHERGFFRSAGHGSMLQPSEVTAAKLLPTIRSRLAQELLEVHKLKQVKVARALGITQAAVSHYNTKSRGLDAQLMVRFPEIDAFCTTLAARIAGGMSQTEQIAPIDRF